MSNPFYETSKPFDPEKILKTIPTMATVFISEKKTELSLQREEENLRRAGFKHTSWEKSIDFWTNRPF